MEAAEKIALPGPAMRFTAIGAAVMALAVAAGAFGAHALRNSVSEYALGVWETAAKYHVYHALGLILLDAVAARLAQPSRLVTAAGWLLLAGIVLFSGSLYVLALTDARWLGMITPLGGTAWIAGWTLLAIAAWRGKRGAAPQP